MLAASDLRERVMSKVLLDAAGRRRSPATMPGFHAGRPPRNKGRRYPADPPTVSEIVAVMRLAGDDPHGRRLRGLIIVLWRAGLRIHEALALSEADLDPRRGAVLVRRGKGGRRRHVGMDDWPGNNSNPGSMPASTCQWDRCSASSPGRLADGRGRRPPREANSGRPPRGRASDAASRHTNCGTRTPARWLRGDAVARHPASPRAQQPRHHLDLPAGHR
jgi:Phage integrase family